MRSSRPKVALAAVLCGGAALFLFSTLGPAPGRAQDAPATQPAATPTSAPTADDTAEYPGHPLPSATGDYFLASGDCAVCHTGIVDRDGNDVSFDRDWSPSPHANSARDPYWQATVRAEVVEHPALRSVIEDKCATCHMPMAETTAKVGDASTAVLPDDGFLSPDHDLHTLAIDGVSCSSCHQIQSTGLGTPDSYSGGYVIDTTTPAGMRQVFGPHAASEDDASLMQQSTGYVPVQSEHIQHSALCATCHNLYTPFVDAASGEVGGVFPEQTPYLEWLASDFRDQHSCQSCHMPEVPGELAVSPMTDTLRSHVSRHLFWAGNTFLLRMLQRFGDELDVAASAEQIQSYIGEAEQRLTESAARVTIPEIGLADGRLRAVVAIEPLTGHKLPTSFPSRRAWLHVVVTDAAGNVVFESGAADDNGAIAGNDNDADATAFEPHYDTIEQPDQVQIYEAILGDTAGRVTTTLLLASQYLKDNRLLPAGFDKATAEADIAPHGAALLDEDFVGGGDRVHYSVDVGTATGPFSVSAQLLYQSIGYRWADNFRAYDAPEPTRFIRFYDATPNTPFALGAASATTE